MRSFKAADIFSLRVILWQEESRTIPFPLQNEAWVTQALLRGEVPKVDEEWAYAPLMTKF